MRARMRSRMLPVDMPNHSEMTALPAHKYAIWKACISFLG